MTCDECVSMLATGSLRDLTADSAVMLHCSRCPDCAQLTTLLRDREYTAATVLNNLAPLSNPITIAETAGRVSGRRRVGQLVVMLTGAALVATIWIAAATTFLPMMTDSQKNPGTVLRTETIPLTCLSPQQAADIINPYVRSRGSTYYVPTSGLSAITVRGTASELAKSRDLVRQFENDPKAACHSSLPGEGARTSPQIAGDKGVGEAHSAPPQVGVPGGVPPGPKK
jgi:hypothetical protein